MSDESDDRAGEGAAGSGHRPGPADADGWVAIVLAGGAARRLGGRDKAALRVGGRSLLERSLAVVAGAREVVVAGPPGEESPTPAGPGSTPPPRFVLEDPPRGGPVAGVLAALDALRDPAPLVCVIAVDMPGLTEDTLARLRAAAGGRDGAVLTDADGRRHLAAALRRASLRERRPDAGGRGLAWRTLLEGLDLAEVPARAAEDRDVDTPEDLAELDRS